MRRESYNRGLRLVAETQARFTRQLLDMDRAHFIDIKLALDRTREVGRIVDYPLVEDRWLPYDEAQWDADKKLIVIRREVYEDALELVPRSRFTIAHELAHCWLGHSFIRNRRTAPGREFGAQRKRDEIAANAFAAEFLAPTHLIKLGRIKRVEQIMEQFGLSESAARHRLLRD